MIIYKTTNLINSKIYIGLSKYDDDEYLGSGHLIIKAIYKYGKENFKKEILERSNNKKHLCEREKYWIKFYNSRDRKIGYNISSGGEYGDTFTNNPNKEEIRKKFIIRSAGVNNGMYGKKHKESTIILLKKAKENYGIGVNNSMAKELYQYDSDGLIFIKKWEFQKECADELKINRGNLSYYSRYNDKAFTTNKIYKKLKKFVFFTKKINNEHSNDI